MKHIKLDLTQERTMDSLQGIIKNNKKTLTLELTRDEVTLLTYAVAEYANELIEAAGNRIEGTDDLADDVRALRNKINQQVNT
jgi:hypothetical protein